MDGKTIAKYFDDCALAKRIDASLDQARREGQESMREKCAKSAR